ncbi:type I-E CRISPR-associated protein Cse2/CasB [Streptomyces sp. NPDC005180]|uniref:type I-E CRISPR-associated protein Cse2/CasB n=1 Tax=Streptomyces sp. NPDC005180 TaxID=3156868 RepID=UPI0033A1B689
MTDIDAEPYGLEADGTEEVAADLDGRTPADRLAAWLAALVRNREYGPLAQLRSPHVKTNVRITAGCFDPDHREIFEKVAFLFAIYHRGASRPSYGYGSLGAAARRIGGGMGRGPNDPGAARLMDRIVATRSIPWRHLQQAVTRLRSCEQTPPSWAQLANDLVQWTDREAEIGYQWAIDFQTPPQRKTGTTRTAAVKPGRPADHQQLTFPTEKGTTT